jgi:hypothetical protein
LPNEKEPASRSAETRWIAFADAPALMVGPLAELSGVLTTTPAAPVDEPAMGVIEVVARRDGHVAVAGQPEEFAPAPVVDEGVDGGPLRVARLVVDRRDLRPGQVELGECDLYQVLAMRLVPSGQQSAEANQSRSVRLYEGPELAPTC